MINEIHPAVEAKNVQATRDAKTTKKLSREKANRSLRLRAIIAASLVVIFYLFAATGLMAWVLALPFIAATGVWLAVWFGAWLQFTFAEGGLLDVRK